MSHAADFVLWSERQAQLLRERNFNDLDIVQLIEELDALGASDRRELRGRLTLLLLHLLKCAYQPQHKASSWIAALGEQRHQIDLLLEQSPSLRKELARYIDSSYTVACKRAAHETGLPASNFPNTNPFSVAQILNLDFLP